MDRSGLSPAVFYKFSVQSFLRALLVWMREMKIFTLQLSQRASLFHTDTMSRRRSVPSPSLPRRSWVEIDHVALQSNLKTVQKLADKADIMAVVKANAYGHGLNEVASTLSQGVDIFAVASLGEALQLRESEKKKPILLLSAALPSEYAEIASQGFIPTISSLVEAQLFAKAATQVRKKTTPPALIHFKINTGMGRLGIQPGKAYEILQEILKLPLALHSISTHLPSADTDSAFTKDQLNRFQSIVAELRPLAPNVPVHVLNSAGTILHPAHTHDLVRVGLLLYGVSPVPKMQKLFKPVLSWKAAVTHIQEIPKGDGISYGGTYTAPRNLKVAVLPAGYADGYPRQLSGKGAAVLINCKRCPVLGRVTMDQIIVDISRAGAVAIGDEAVLVGTQGDKEITATEVASQADTIPWHLFCGITARVVYWHQE
jgi:alanine racemase